MGTDENVHNAVLLLVHLNLRGAAHLDNSDATGQFGAALLQFLLLIVLLGGLDGAADELAPLVNGRLVLPAVEHDRVVLGDDGFLEAAWALWHDHLEFHTGPRCRFRWWVWRGSAWWPCGCLRNGTG